jgi:hypothetical protein
VRTRTSSSSLVALAFLVAIAAAGDTIYVGRGTCTGTFGIGHIESARPLELIGSYDEAFSARNIEEPPTVFQPTNEAGARARKAFLSARYAEQVDFNPDSPAILWRQAVGLNEQGRIDSAVTMFMNRYPWRDTLRLLGAMKEYGAQELQ